MIKCNRVLSTRVELGAKWSDYPRIEPGIYPAYCRWAKQYRDRAYRRWTCLLRFDVLTPDLLRKIATVPMWFNLGSELNPFAGRRSNYFKEWIRASSEPPGRKDRLSPNVFLRRIAQVDVADINAAAPYSVVRKILFWDTGESRVIQSTKSHSQGRHVASAAITID